VKIVLECFEKTPIALRCSLVRNGCRVDHDLLQPTVTAVMADQYRFYRTHIFTVTYCTASEGIVSEYIDRCDAGMFGHN